MKLKAQAQVKAGRKARKVQLPKAEEKEPIKPRLFDFRRADLSSFDRLFESNRVISGTELPPLENCGISLEGMSKSGKSALYAGNPRLIVAKCYDGHPILPRCRAKVIECPDYRTLDKLLGDLLDIGRRKGKDSPYCQVCIDPTVTWIRWLCDRAVERYNRKFHDPETGRLLPGAKGKLLESVSDMEGYGPYGSIADHIERVIRNFGEVGWGWILPTHYQWKAAPGFKGSMDFRPSIPPTAAERITALADVLVVTERDGDVFTVNYESRKTLALGARVPLMGSTELPNYLDPDCPPGVTSWDYFDADYRKACEEFSRDQARFERAYRAMLNGTGKEKD